MRSSGTCAGLRGLLVSYTRGWLCDVCFFQTSLLPEDDRTSVSYKQYLAGIDVSMGGRVAEELSQYFTRLGDFY